MHAPVRHIFAERGLQLKQAFRAAFYSEYSDHMPIVAAAVTQSLVNSGSVVEAGSTSGAALTQVLEHASSSQSTPDTAHVAKANAQANAQGFPGDANVFVAETDGVQQSPIRTCTH